jgi:hypothetical protein
MESALMIDKRVLQLVVKEKSSVDIFQLLRSLHISFEMRSSSK